MKKLLVFVSALLLLFGSFGLAGAAIITVDPLSPDTVNLNDIFTLNLIGQDFNLGSQGGGLTIGWDPNVLTLVDDPLTTSSPLTAQVVEGLNRTFPPDAALPGETGYFTDIVSYGTDSSGPVTLTTFSFSVSVFGGSVGPGFDIAELSFLASGVGSSIIDITPSGSDVWTDFVGSLANPTATDGNVNVVPIPGAFLLLGSGLIGLVALRRKLS